MIGPYEVERELGRGGMGVVYAVRRRAPGPPGRLALKVLLAPPDGESLARFEREVALARELGADAGFVPLVDAGVTAEGRPYAVFPLIEGGSLRGRLARGPLPVAAAVELVRTLAVTLGRAHARGVCHRDVKPENVLFDGGRPLVADLGLAGPSSLEGDRSRLTATGSLAGSVGYAAPEQLDSLRQAGAPADVFALGVVLHEALTGERPFRAEGLLSYAQALEKPPRAPSSFNRSVPPWLDAVCAKCLRRDPKERFGDGAALAAALAGGARRAARGPLVAGVATALVALVAVLVVGRGPSARDPDPAPPPPPPVAPTSSATPAPPVRTAAARAAEYLDAASRREAVIDVVGARTFIANAIELAPESKEARVRAFSICLQAQDPSEARLHLEALERIAPGAPETELLKGVLFGDPPRLLEWLGLEAERVPTAAWPLVDRAELLRRMRHYKAARCDAERALARNIKHAKGWAVLGGTLAELGIVQQKLGSSVEAVGTLVLAVACNERSIALAPDVASTWQNLHWARRTLGVPLQATIDGLGRQLAVTRHPVRFHGLRAWLREQLEPPDLRGALEDLDAALAIEPDYKEGLKVRGMVHSRLGDMRRARADYEGYLARVPSGEQADEVRALLEKLPPDPR